MTYRDLYELEKYLQVAYLEYRDREQAYFQLQFIEVNVRFNEKVDFYEKYIRTVRLAYDRDYSADINRKQKEHYTSVKGSPQHSKMNILKRQRSKSSCEKLTKVHDYN